MPGQLAQRFIMIGIGALDNQQIQALFGVQALPEDVVFAAIPAKSKHLPVF